MFGIFKRKNKIELKSPFIGKAIEITKVPDEVFASKMVGDGLAFEPSEGIVYSPVDGEIVSIFPTKHAIGIKTQEGLEILIHIGVDTINMKGEGFESFVNEGDKIKAGDKLMAFDIRLVLEKAKSAVSPLIITNLEIVDSMKFHYGGVNKNSTAVIITLK